MEKRNVVIGIIVVLLLVGLIGAGIYYGQPTSQSILSFSNVEEIDGKLFWLVTASANNIDEGVNFLYRSPNARVNSAGDTVEPVKGMSLSISKESSRCEYQTTKNTKSYSFGVFPFKVSGSVDYYTLGNAQRVADVKFKEGGDVSSIIDATVVDTIVLEDSDGEGEIVIQTQGLLAGKVDCPEVENVVVVVANNGEVAYLKRDLFLGLEDSLLPGIASGSTDESIFNSVFTSAFDSQPEFVSLNLVKGDIPIGNGVFTITADQDYFDSVVFSPPKPVNPKIENIFVSNEIANDASSTMQVEVINLEDNSGTIRISASSSSDINVFPTSKNEILNDIIKVAFTLKSSDNAGDEVVSIEVCSTGQFSSSNCDSESVSIRILEKDDPLPEERCGDGDCQSSETKATCPEDCLELGGGNGIDDGDCKAIVLVEKTFLTGEVSIPNVFCEINKLVERVKLILAVILGLLGGLIGASYVLRFARFRKTKTNAIVGISVLVILGLIIGFLAFQFFWAILIFLIIVGVVRAFVPGI